MCTSSMLFTGRRLGMWVVVAVAVAFGPVVSMEPAAATPPPWPPLWNRLYVAEDPLPTQDVYNEAVADCLVSASEGYRENGAPGPRIAVLGDSAENQNRKHALADPAIHWIYDTHCGEKFATAIDDGRVAEVVAAHPQVLVMALGNNDFNEEFQFRPDLVPAALDNIRRVLDATEGIPCRVFVNLPRVAPITMPVGQRSAWQDAAAQLNAAYEGARSRPGVHVADWSSLIAPYWPHWSIDGIHLTHAGINARMNLELATARQCWPPDSPIGLGSAASFGSADLWWAPLPTEEGITDYLVELSDGRSVATTKTSLTVTGLTNDVPAAFRVTAINGAGAGEPSAWSNPFVPSASGTRFFATSPRRVLDTRDGTGGKATSFGDGETARLDLSGTVPAGASAVVLNITAVGPTRPTFITAWPGDQPQPLASNLNPRPGVTAVPAMVTTRLAADRSINLFNNTGSVHLVADVVGYYGPTGASDGALYTAVTPARLLDTRLHTGPKSTPFGAGETLILPIPSVPTDASGVVLNVTATDTTAAGFVTVWPSGRPQPLASNLNPQPGLTRANLTVARLGGGQAIDIFNNSGSTDLVVDLVGYFTAEGAIHGGSTYYPIPPTRFYDTRDATGGIPGPVSTATNAGFSFPGVGSLPTTGVSAVDANITITEPTAGGHTTVWPSGPTPTVSNLNYEARETVANRDLITLDPGGTALAWSTSPTIHYVIDVTGWFGPTL